MADEFDLSGLGSALGVKASSEKSKVKLNLTGSPEEQLELIKGIKDQNYRAEAMQAWTEKYGNVSSSVSEPTGEFNLSGLKAALQGQPEPQSTAVQEPKVQPPSAQKMFEPKTQVEQNIQSTIQSIPGIQEASAFANKAAATVSKSVSAVQQLVGQYFPGLSDETRKAISENAIKNVQAAEQAVKPLEEESPKAALAGEVTGYLVNPVNKLVPGFGGPAQSLTGAVAKGAAQGAIANVLTEPATSEEKPFATQKLEQATTGGVFGGAFGGGLHLLTSGLASATDAVRKRFGNNVPAGQIDNAAAQVLREAGVDANKVDPDYFRSLLDQAKTAVRTGDVTSLKQFARNYTEANELGVPMLRGQLTRDPMQYAVEQNLRGIQGVGEPIQQVLQAQNKALLQRLDDFGASKGQSITTSGFTVRNALRQADAADAQKVSDAYKAFRASTGKNINVPLQGVAQDYANVLRDFGADQIPSGVRNNFEALGLLTGKQRKVVTIDDVENLIKNINLNYDPVKQPNGTINALDNLRQSLNNAIKDAGANLPGEAGQLARESRKTAEQRFKTIEGIPALRDALRGKEPDKFVQTHILQGNVDQISKMTKYLQENNPEALAQVQSDIIKHIKDRVTNNIGDENAKFSQAQLKNFVSGPMGDRLRRILSPEQFNNLAKLNRVAENALIEPVSSAVNKSNTASAAANFVKGTVNSGAISDLLTNIAGIKFPGVTWAAQGLQQMNQRAKAAELINQAVTPTAPAPSVPIKGMVKPGIAGAGLGVGVIEQRNKELERSK